MQAMAKCIVEWFMNSHLVQGVVFTTVLSILRVVYDEKETKIVRIGLEGAIAGCITLSAGAAIRAMGANEEWTLFVGGLIGSLGVVQVREIARYALKRAIDFRTGGKTDEQP